MQSLLNSLGLDYTIFFSQLVNFIILYVLLKKFALEKLLRSINKRQEMIADGVRNAQNAKLVLVQVKTQQEEIISDARAKAREILAQARQDAKLQTEKITAAAGVKAEQLLADAHEQIQTEKQKMLLEVKNELADIIAIGVAKVADKKVDSSEISRHYLKNNLQA